MGMSNVDNNTDSIRMCSVRLRDRGVDCCH